jgi:hypothetical protein
MQPARATLFVTLGSFKQGPGPLTSRDEADSARSAAIKECSDKASRISYRDYQTWQLTAYRSCMFDHGQLE